TFLARSLAASFSSDMFEPVFVAVDFAVDDAEEQLLDLARDLARTADLAVVDGADRHDLSGGPGEEGLVGEVEVMPPERPFADLVPQVACHRHYRRARDAVERAGRQRRGDDGAVLHQEQVLTSALRDLALRVEQDRLVVPRLQRLDLRE